MRGATSPASSRTVPVRLGFGLGILGPNISAGFSPDRGFLYRLPQAEIAAARRRRNEQAKDARATERGDERLVNVRSGPSGFLR